MQQETPLLILGRGYVGRAVAAAVPGARSTRRDIFELGKKETWNKDLLTLPSQGRVLWTFPAASSSEEEELAIELYDTFFRGLKVIVYGSTSAYQSPGGRSGEPAREQDPWVTEETQLDLDEVRTRTEESLRKRGACILQLAGIFGPGRDPISWYQRGLIQAGLSYLNLIHLQDIVSITLKVFECDKIAGERFNLSNGAPKTHLEIVEELKRSGRLPSDFSIPAIRKPGSKRVSNEKVKRLLSLNHDDFIGFP